MKAAPLRLAAAIFCFALVAPAAFRAEENERPQKLDGVRWTAEPLFGARLGQCKEIVWTQKSSGGDYKISELVYDILPAWYIGANVGVECRRFGLQFLSKFFLPAKSGTLTDSDWQNGAVNGDTSTKTDYSEHSLYLNPTAAGVAGYDLELQADVKFYPARFLTLAPLLSFNAQYMGFKAKNGTGYYGGNPDTDVIRPSYSDASNRRVKDYSGQSVLAYDVYNFFLWTGLRADFFPSDWAAISVATEFSPFSIFYDKDHHLTNGKQFIDTAYSAFLAFRQTVKAEFKIKKYFSICQKTTLAFTGESKGVMYGKMETEKAYKKQQGSAGGQLFYVDLELSAKFVW